MHYHQKLKSMLRDRLGSDYTEEIGERAAQASREFAKRRFEFSQQAKRGEIDSATFALRMNQAAAIAIDGLREILGERFDQVVGEGGDFTLADPDIASEIDYTQVPESVWVTREDIRAIVDDPVCVDILHILSEGPRDINSIAGEINRLPSEFNDELVAMQEAQLISGQIAKSVTARVRVVSGQHGSRALVLIDDAGGEWVCSRARGTGMDPQDRAHLERELTGLWDYSCHADEGSELFSDNEVGRAGILKITAYANTGGGIDAVIEAKRCWKIAPGGDKQPVDPIEWRSEGGVSVSRAGVSFEYTIEGESGRSEDTFALIAAGPLNELSGTFVHTRADKREVRGTVKLVKQTADERERVPRAAPVPD